MGVQTDHGYVPVNNHMQSNIPHIYAAGDLSGRLPLSSVATMQGRKIAEHAMGLTARGNDRQIDYDKAASAIFTEPEIADVGLAEAEAFSSGRKIRVTKVPFSATAKAMINNDTQGFVKIISDPNTGVVLGSGKSIGNKRIVVWNSTLPDDATQLVLNVLDAKALPVIRNFAAYHECPSQ